MPTRIANRVVTRVAIAGIAGVSGCAAGGRDTRESAFADVQATLADRGVPRVAWNAHAGADATAAAALSKLLSGGETTADDAVQVALLGNRRLQATYEELGVAQADLVQAGLLRNPVFDAEIKLAENGGGTMLELAVVQEFLDVFQVPLRRRLADQALGAAKLRVSGAVLDLAGRVRQAFYDHQAATQAVEMRQTVLEAAGVSLDFARRLREAGNITELRLARERAVHEQAKLDLAAAEAEVLATRERLNTLMGLWGPDAQAWRAAPRLADVPDAPPDVAGVESRAVGRSLDLAAARAELDATADALGVTRSFALFGGGDVELGVAAEREPDGAWAVGPAVSVPIPLFDTGAAGVSRAQAELRRARQNYAATAVEIRAAARAARDRLLSARGRALHYRNVVLPLRHAIVEQTQAELNAMIVGAFDVLQAKQDEVEAGAAYVASLREYWVAHAQLEQVVNGRMPSDFETTGTTPSRTAERGAENH